MTKGNLGLGVLALPSVFSVLGIVPGIILILVIQTIIICEYPLPVILRSCLTFDRLLYRHRHLQDQPPPDP